MTFRNVATEDIGYDDDDYVSTFIMQSGGQCNVKRIESEMYKGTKGKGKGQGGNNSRFRL